MARGRRQRSDRQLTAKIGKFAPLIFLVRADWEKLPREWRDWGYEPGVVAAVFNRELPRRIRAEWPGAMIYLDLEGRETSYVFADSLGDAELEQTFNTRLAELEAELWADLRAEAGRRVDGRADGGPGAAGPGIYLAPRRVDDRLFYAGDVVVELEGDGRPFLGSLTEKDEPPRLSGRRRRGNAG